MERKPDSLPVTLKIDYKEEIELKVTILPKFNNQKFYKHSLVLGGFDRASQYLISKKYYSYLNQGDLIHILGDFTKINWRQKQNRQNQKFMEIYSSKNSTRNNITSNENSVSEVENQTLFRAKLIRNIERVLKLLKDEQSSQLSIFTLIINYSNGPIISQIFEILKNQNVSNFFGGIFLKDPTEIKIKGIETSFLEQWAEIYALSQFQKQLRQFTHNISKLSVKKIRLNLKCYDGELTQGKKQSCNQWKLSDQRNLSIDIYHPKCNKMYIYAISVRNLGLKQSYHFELKMIVKDIQNKVLQASKQFQLKPSKEFIQKHDDHLYNFEHQPELLKKFRNGQSLACDRIIDCLDKFNEMKILCQRTYIQIRNNIVANNTQLQDQQDTKSMRI